MSSINFARNFHHVNTGRETKTSIWLRMCVTFIITVVIKYLLAQNKDMVPILIDSLKFSITKFITLLLVGLLFMDVIIPLFYGRNFILHVTENQFVDHPVTDEILKNIESFLIVVVFYFVNKFINSIGDASKPFKIDDILNVTLEQLMVLRSFN